MYPLIAFIISLFVFAPPIPSERPDAIVGQCDPVDGQRPKWTPEARTETRKRVKRACKQLGGSKRMCAFLDLIVVRESSGRAGVRHTMGENENGLGPMGLSIRWHGGKWPGKDEDPMFCTPEVSTIVAMTIFHRARRRYNAETIVELQAIYSGRGRCYTNPETEKRECIPAPSARTYKLVCPGMERRGYSCRVPMEKKELGAFVPLEERRETAERLVEEWKERQKDGDEEQRAVEHGD